MFSSLKHCDLGCGEMPRNPYGAPESFGVDIFANADNIKHSNLSLDPIPFADNSLDSVSAYDFLEHIPRVLIDPVSGNLVFPFIRLMDEVHRVLRFGGRFYASTPCFPHASVFVDPTHVNPFNIKTHRYFTGTNPLARMYGFQGRFDLIRVCRYRPRSSYEPTAPGLYRRLQRWIEGLTGDASHVLWEFEKPKI